MFLRFRDVIVNLNEVRFIRYCENDSKLVITWNDDELPLVFCKVSLCEFNSIRPIINKGE